MIERFTHTVDRLKSHMAERCKAQGHEWVGMCSPDLRHYEACRWCTETRDKATDLNFREQK